ncbi:MAG: FkbM family methyltransferase [Sulfurimonas sp.]|jgi:FkbM family methyltransferase
MQDYEELIFDTFVKDAKVIYDIGAFNGRFTNFFANKPGVEQVIAIEPFPANFLELTENTKHLTNVKLFNIGLSDKEYTCKTVIRNCRRDELKYVEDTIVFKELVNFINENNLPLPNFQKIDCEGAESRLGKSLLEIYKTGHKMTCCIETHCQPREDLTDVTPDNPHYQYPDQNGWDLNDFKPYCNIYKHYAHSREYTKLDENIDWAPLPGFFGMYVLESK